MIVSALNFVVQNGYTPLHCASVNGHTNVVKLLADHKARVDIPTSVSIITIKAQ